MERPTWEEIFMFNAVLWATRHSCLKRPVGAVLVKDKRIIATGYNGAATGLNSCLDLGYCYYESLAYNEFNAKKQLESKKDFGYIKEKNKIFCLAVHAEANALSQCDRDKARGSTLYITNTPCPKCAQDIVITHGIEAVKVWKDYLSDPLTTMDEERATKEKFVEAGIKFLFIPLTKERIIEIATYMADQVGERTSYQFQI